MTYCSLPSLTALVFLLALCSIPAHANQPEQDPTASLSPSGADSVAIATLTHNKEQLPSVDDLELLSSLQDDNNNVGKRAYSYVSEYKRLPVYNFGLGKRSQSQLYSFGLGKRSSGGRTYSFGLGKRSEDYDDPDEIGVNDDSNEDEMTNAEDMFEKRNRLYSFGLGKRVKPYSFGLGKRSPRENSRLYGFGLGKRGRPSMYDFGLGKRADNSRLYSFGLGKRPSTINRNSRFNFGLGKRSYEEEDDDVDIDEDDDDVLDELKRSLGDHRFSFGLGKREISSNELEEMKDEVTNKKVSTTGQHDADHVITKRSLHYGFGLGKRSRLELEDDPRVSFTTQDMSRYVRRPYSFGLGKRIPKYDFGIGKKSDR